jgi:hypothetical protein
VIGRKETEGEADLFEVIRAFDSLSFPFTQGDRRNQGREQQGKNDDDHEQFDRRERSALASRVTTIHLNGRETRRPGVMMRRVHSKRTFAKSSLA